MADSPQARRIAESITRRNGVSRAFFETNAERLSTFAERAAERLFAGGRLLAFGSGPQVTDAQHAAVEFVHPGIVGKPALPALELSANVDGWLEVVLRPEDVVIAQAPPMGDELIARAARSARKRGAWTLAVPAASDDADLALPAPAEDPYVHQEMLMVLYHVLWEAVHVFGEHRGMGEEVGGAGFLYPFLEAGSCADPRLVTEVAGQIGDKARRGEDLRTRCAAEEADRIGRAAAAIAARLAAGGKVITFGNGGSATAACDLARDFALPPRPDTRPVPAVSLAWEAATISAVANDVGAEAIFLRQLVSHCARDDVAIGITTSGSSANVVAALAEARRRGLLTIAFAGRDGGLLGRAGNTDFAFVVPSESVHRIQEVQATIGHVLREAVDDAARE